MGQRRAARVRGFGEKFYDDLQDEAKLSEQDPRHLAKLVARWREKAVSLENGETVHGLRSKVGRLRANEAKHTLAIRLAFKDLKEGRADRALTTLAHLCPWLERGANG